MIIRRTDMKYRKNKIIVRLTALTVCLITLFSAASCGKDEIVKFSIPSLFLSESALNDLASYCEANGYLDAEFDEKHEKVNITMTGTE